MTSQEEVDRFRHRRGPELQPTNASSSARNGNGPNFALRIAKALGPMKDFLDLKGAAGAFYRFRIWPEGAPHLPIAGNYVFLKAEPEDFIVLLVGATNDLSRARDAWGKVVERGATHAFTRLNVARAVRTAEHDDLVASYKPPLVDDGA